jgi:hypothetical protein
MKTNEFLRKLLLTAACFIFVIMNVKAQTHPIQNAFATISEANGTSTATFTVVVEDTNAVSQIKTILATEQDSSDLVNQVFDYDVTNGLPLGVSYQRTGNQLTLTVSGFTGVSTYFGEVSVKNNSNSWSNFKFITN